MDIYPYIHIHYLYLAVVCVKSFRRQIKFSILMIQNYQVSKVPTVNAVV